MTSRQAFYITCVVLATLGMAYLLLQLGQILIVLFLAILLASTLRPLVDSLSRRRIPRGVAILLLYLFLILIVFGLLVASIPPLAGLISELFSTEILSERVYRFFSWLAFFGWDTFKVILPVLTLPEKVLAFVDQIQQQAQRQVWPIALDSVLVIGQVILAFVMCYYWLTAREPALSLLLRLSPLRHRAVVEKLWNDVENTLGAYVRGQVILMFAVGLACYLGLVVLGIPFAPALAVIAALTEAIPIVGPIAGAIPAVLVGLTISWPMGLAVAALYLVVQQLEAHILVPRVMHRAVGLHPLVVILALVMGGILNGVVGALIAIPIAGAIQVIVHHLLIEPALQKRGLPREGRAVLVADEDEASNAAAPDEERPPPRQ
ncbi:MAG: AI-2E family transporter [Anaerolineae bacterium]|nr:AI-2E family transporter [Anaerolineae bacterium]